MPEAWTRRQALALAGSAFSLGLAGCSGNPDSESSPSPSPTTSHTNTPTPTETPIPDEIPLDAFNFDVKIVNQFTNEHPARIEATFTNTAETSLTLDEGLTPPFSQYWSKERDDGESLFIVPDISESAYDESPLAWFDSEDADEALPSTPVADVCWRPLNQALDELIAQTTPVESGESLTQPFDVYDWHFNKDNDECLAAGDYIFENPVGLTRGYPHENPTKDFTLQFTLTIHDDKSLSISVPTPAG